jgi:hypothetical protein
MGGRRDRRVKTPDGPDWRPCAGEQPVQGGRHRQPCRGISGDGFGIDPLLRFPSIEMMRGLTVVLLPLLRRGNRLNRLKGGLVLLAYLIYTGFWF